MVVLEMAVVAFPVDGHGRQEVLAGKDVHVLVAVDPLVLVTEGDRDDDGSKDGSEDGDHKDLDHFLAASMAADHGQVVGGQVVEDQDEVVVVQLVVGLDGETLVHDGQVVVAVQDDVPVAADRLDRHLVVPLVHLVPTLEDGLDVQDKKT